MYVCLCNGVTDHQIRKSIHEGASSLHDLQNTLGVATQCGQCACLTQELLDQNRAEQDNLAYAVA